MSSHMEPCQSLMSNQKGEGTFNMLICRCCCSQGRPLTLWVQCYIMQVLFLCLVECIIGPLVTWRTLNVQRPFEEPGGWRGKPKQISDLFRQSSHWFHFLFGLHNCCYYGHLFLLHQTPGLQAGGYLTSWLLVITVMWWSLLGTEPDTPGVRFQLK